MTTASFRYRLFVFVLMAGGLWAMYTARPTEWAYRPWENPTVTLLWVAMMIVASLSLIPLPRRRYGLSLVTALDMGAFFVFGPGVAAWCALLSRLVSITHDRWNPFLFSLARLGSVGLGFGLAAWTYAALGGNASAPSLATQNDFFMGLGAAAAYLAVRLTTWGVSMVARWGMSWQDMWKKELGLQALFDVALLPFAALLALTQLHLGTVGVALFLVPLLLVRYSIKLWMETRDAHLVAVRVLMEALDASDPFTRGVSRRVSGMAVRIGRAMNLPEKEIEELEYASLLHDIGRFAIHREILRKPGSLNTHEANEVTLGPLYACEMIQNIGLFRGAAEIVLNHHERPDGKGYPRGIRGHSIPVGSRIIMVASAFNAMISDRPYRRGLTPREAIDELLVHTGTQFAPEVVETLITLYSAGTLFAPEDDESWVAPGEEPAASGGIPHKKEPAEFPKVLELPQGGSKITVVAGDRNLKVKASAKSDVGCVRAQNEDAILVNTLADKSMLLAVADGMGGAKGGAVASSLAVEHLKSVRKGDREVLVRALEEANCIIHDRGSQDENLRGMGTTATVAVIKRGRLQLAHVGDSRAYLINDAGITQLTEDHTLGMELKRASGQAHPDVRGMDHVLTRCLGVAGTVNVDAGEEPVALKHEDVVLLCSDGLTGVVTDEEIRTLAFGEEPAQACRELVELARERGGPDNISVVIGVIR